MVLWLMILIHAAQNAARITGKGMRDVILIPAGRLLKADYGLGGAVGTDGMKAATYDGGRNAAGAVLEDDLPLYQVWQENRSNPPSRVTRA